jgi:hypothetical protein
MKVILENTRSGEKTLVIENQGRRYSIYSQYEPIHDGVRFFERFFRKGDDCYLFIGLGLGYQIAPFLAQPTVKKIIVVEPSHEVWESVKAVPMVREIAESEKVELYSGSEGELFISALKGRYDFLLYNRIKVLAYQPLIRAFEPLYAELEQRIKNEIDELIGDGLTIAGFASRWLKNFTKNIKTGCRIMLASSLFDSWSGSAVVVGAGPSLDEALDEIEGKKEHVFIISTDAALKPVLARGIRPDLICSMDPQPCIVSHFEGVPKDVLLNVPSVLSALSPPQVFSLFRRRYLFFTRHPTTALVLDDRFRGSAIMNFGSVGSLAAAMAVRMGFSRVYLAGFDFSFPGMRVYAKNSFFYDYLLRETNRFSPFVTSEIQRIHGRGKRWKSAGSRILYTSTNLLSYLDEMERLIHQSECGKRAEFYVLRGETFIRGAGKTNSLFKDTNCKKICEKKEVITISRALPREGEALEPLIHTLALRLRFYRGMQDPERAWGEARALFEKNSAYMSK